MTTQTTYAQDMVRIVDLEDQYEDFGRFIEERHKKIDLLQEEIKALDAEAMWYEDVMHATESQIAQIKHKYPDRFPIPGLNEAEVERLRQRALEAEKQHNEGLAAFLNESPTPGFTF